MQHRRGDCNYYYCFSITDKNLKINLKKEKLLNFENLVEFCQYLWYNYLKERKNVKKTGGVILWKNVFEET